MQEDHLSQEWVLKEPFRAIDLSESNDTALVKTAHQGGNCVVLVSDLGSLWGRYLTLEELGKLCEEANPHLESSPQRLSTLALESMGGLLEHPKFSLSSSEGGKEITFSSDSEAWKGIHLHCTLTLPLLSSSLLHLHLIQPLVHMMKEAKHQKDFLLEIIAKKDRALEEYRASGVKLPRKQLDSPKFDPKDIATSQKPPSKKAKLCSVVGGAFNDFWGSILASMNESENEATNTEEPLPMSSPKVAKKEESRVSEESRREELERQLMQKAKKVRQFGRRKLAL